jgi:hypothetical protein
MLRRELTSRTMAAASESASIHAGMVVVADGTRPLAASRAS